MTPAQALSFGLYGHAMHDVVIREIEEGERAAVWDDLDWMEWPP